MRFTGLALLLLCQSAAADTPTPQQPAGIQGTLTRYRTAGRPGGKDSSGPLVCTFEVTAANGRSSTVTTDDTGKFKRSLAPGLYTLSFAKCTAGCGRVEPAIPATIDVRPTVFTKLDLRCTVFGK